MLIKFRNMSSDGREIVWCENVRYLGVHVVSSKSFTCSLSNAKRSFYRSFNAIFGRVGHIASEAVIVELVNSKCLPTLLYGLEACPLKSADLQMFLLPADSADRVDVVYTETAIILPVCHS